MKFLLEYYYPNWIDPKSSVIPINMWNFFEALKEAPSLKLGTCICES